MSVDLSRYAKNAGSGRSKLPEQPSFQGVKFQGYTTADRMALSLGAGDEGLAVFDTDVNALVVWNGTGWTDTDASTDANQPTFTSVTASSGTTAGGTNVTIVGTHLLGTTGVTFGGVAATNVHVVDATHVTCTTPAHASGAVSVVITTKDGPVTAASAFTYS